jgi:peptide/nickel transport system substrate-binding protein
VAVALFALAATLTANTEARVSTSGAGAQTPATGGRVIFRMCCGPDWIDPGQTYYSVGFMLSGAVNRPLYSYTPDHPLHPVPDLAEGDPQISADGKKVTVTLKTGIHFSPPVNREVTSRDVKYAIERAFTRHVPNGYVFIYFSDLVGAPDDFGPLTDIAGIETPDERTIVFRLERPTATTLAGALTLPITVPVPREYARPFDRERPSTYDSHVVFTGPYMIRNDADGNLVGLADDIEIVRNPNWDPAGDFRPAYVDEIRFRFSDVDFTTMARHTLQGSHRLCCDASDPDWVRKFGSSYQAQIGSAPGHGTRWVSLNTRVKPLTHINVRKALAAAMDRKGLRHARGGRLAGRLAQHFLSPGGPGFAESGGFDGFGHTRYLQHPGGDLALARRYMLRAGRHGVHVSRHGNYAGSRSLLMVGTDSEPGRTVAHLVKRGVEALGFDVHLKLVPPDEMYTKWCGVPSAKVAICPNVGWFADFFDPESLLEPTFSGHAIRRSGSNNYSVLDDADINRAMRQASTLLPGPARWRAWAGINRMVTKQVPGIPYLWDVNYAVESPDVLGVINPYFGSWDLSFTSLKP